MSNARVFNNETIDIHYKTTGAHEVDVNDLTFNTEVITKTFAVKFVIGEADNIRDDRQYVTAICSGDKMTFTNSSQSVRSEIWRYRVKGTLTEHQNAEETSVVRTITINYYNTAPTANDISHNIHWKATTNSLAFDASDDNGDSLTYEISSAADGGI